MFIINYLLPFFGLLTLNSLTFRKILASNKKRKHLSVGTKSNNDYGLATLMFCVVIVFFVCNFFDMFIGMNCLLKNKHVTDYIELSNTLITLNSCLNFIIYCIIGRKFKQIFRKLFCCKNRENNENTNVGLEN